MENNRVEEQVAMKLFLDSNLRNQASRGEVPECLRELAHIIPKALTLLVEVDKKIDELVVDFEFL